MSESNQQQGKKFSFLKLLGAIALFVLVSIVGCLGLVGKAVHDVSEDNKAEAAASEKLPISDIKWMDIDKIYNTKSNYTDLQKKKEWKRFENKKVKWSGSVSSVGEMLGSITLQVKMNMNTFTSDVIVYLKDTERTKAEAYSEGQPVTFTGVLKDWGRLTPITLKYGEIITNK